MPQLAGTTDNYDIKGQREDLTDKIWMISPEDTVFLSNIKTGSAKSTRHEWQTDTLVAPNPANAQIEGDEFGYADRPPTTRVGNITQIARKTILISGTAEAVDKAGRKSEMRYQAAKVGKEIKKDIEASLLTNQASVVGSSTVARKLGGFPAWLQTNVSRGAGGSNGGYNAGSGLVTAYTSGTARPFTEAMIKSTMQSCFVSGGNPRMLMLSPTEKLAFSAFTGNAQNRKEAKGAEQMTLIGAADVYVSDFGTLTAVPNRIMGALGYNDAHFLDPMGIKIAWLRRLAVVKPTQTGDATKRVMIGEYTLEVGNEAMHGTVADLNG